MKRTALTAAVAAHSDFSRICTQKQTSLTCARFNVNCACCCDAFAQTMAAAAAAANSNVNFTMRKPIDLAKLFFCVCTFRILVGSQAKFCTQKLHTKVSKPRFRLLAEIVGLARNCRLAYLISFSLNRSFAFFASSFVCHDRLTRPQQQQQQKTLNTKYFKLTTNWFHTKILNGYSLLTQHQLIGCSS